jgi:hypothetical protein
MSRIDVKVGDWIEDRDGDFFQISEFDGVMLQAVGRHRRIHADARSDGTIWSWRGQSQEQMFYLTQFEYELKKIQT